MQSFLGFSGRDAESFCFLGRVVSCSLDGDTAGELDVQSTKYWLRSGMSPGAEASACSSEECTSGALATELIDDWVEYEACSGSEDPTC